MNRRLFLTWITASLAYYLIPEAALAEGTSKGEEEDEGKGKAKGKAKDKFHGRWRKKSAFSVVLRQNGSKVRGWVTIRKQRKRFKVQGKTDGSDVLVVDDLGPVKRVGKNLVFADDNGTLHTFTPY